VRSDVVSQVLTVCRQNEQMKERLGALGFQMPLEDLSFKGPFPFAEHDGEDDATLKQPETPHSQPTSSHTAGRSAPRTRPEEGTAFITPHARPLKRPRLESPLPGRNSHGPYQIEGRGSNSRDLMPPPEKPLSKMTSIKKLWPSLRRKVQGGQVT
jgi:hypothetical protein